MVTVRDESGVSSPTGDRPATTVRAEPLVVLDLDAVRPPSAPDRLGSRMLSFRVTPRTDLLLRERADRERTTVSHLLRTLAEQATGEGRWPADVEAWLVRQANQCGCPGDLDRAVVLVVRHLAARWPNGGRLNP